MLSPSLLFSADHALVLSQLWQRSRVRAVDRSGQTVTELALKRDQPFQAGAHLGLVDAIMRAYMDQVASVPALLRDIV